jgi:hypothetical protein
MPTQQEIDEVRTFLTQCQGEWVSCQDCESRCPSLLHRKTDDADCLPYHINSVVEAAGLTGGVEEHGYDKWFVRS